MLVVESTTWLDTEDVEPGDEVAWVDATDAAVVDEAAESVEPWVDIDWAESWVELVEISVLLLGLTVGVGVVDCVVGAEESEVRILELEAVADAEVDDNDDAAAGEAPVPKGALFCLR